MIVLLEDGGSCYTWRKYVNLDNMKSKRRVAKRALLHKLMVLLQLLSIAWILDTFHDVPDKSH